MITTLNPYIGFAAVVASLLGLENEIASTGTGIVAFFIGAAAALPLIVQVWRTMKKNWPDYRKFYSMPFHKRDMKAIKRCWRTAWWVIPYSLVVYSVVDLFILLNPITGTPYSMFYGALFVVFGYTLLQGHGYYDDIIKKKNKLRLASIMPS